YHSARPGPASSQRLAGSRTHLADTPSFASFGVSSASLSGLPAYQPAPPGLQFHWTGTRDGRHQGAAGVHALTDADGNGGMRQDQAGSASGSRCAGGLQRGGVAGGVGPPLRSIPRSSDGGFGTGTQRGARPPYHRYSARLPAGQATAAAFGQL